MIIDCFAGGGGASTGIEMALGVPVDIAVNHDPEAIRMHKANHPRTLHLTEDIFKVDLRRYVGGRHVDILWASPDCTQFSKAKGGKPRESGIRMLPWAVYKHVSELLPDVVFMENVEEIQDWGPLDENGRPIREKMGEEYRRFVHAMQDIGYDFGSRELVAADYGAPTTRRRWYAVFRRDGRPVAFPAPTHARGGAGGLKPWVPVSSVLDFTDLGASIFDRPRPLAEATLKRIANGIRKFIVDCPDPFFLPEDVAMPFLIQYHGETRDGDARGQVVSEPLQTIDTSNRYGLVSVFLTKFYGCGTGQDAGDPLHTITTSAGHFGMISAFLIKYYGTGGGQSLDAPLATVVTKDRFGLASVVILRDGQQYRIADIRLRMLKPEELKLAQGFPKDYVISHDADGNRYPVSEQVRRIGNSVVPAMAQALVEANCGYLARRQAS